MNSVKKNSNREKLPYVGVIILNWNGLKNTIECIESLKRIKYDNYKIIVIDNGSSDDSVKRLKEKYSDIIKIIETGSNLGYAEGNNVGIRYALSQGAKYVLILNNDVIVDPEFLNYLVDVAESDSKVGAVGPLVFHSNTNTIQSFGVMGDQINTQRVIGKGETNNNQYTRIESRDSLMGCAFLLRSDMLQIIGLIDTSYFLYFEDTDLCLRIRENGYILYVDPRSKVWHMEMGSSQNVKPKVQYYIARNKFIFAKKHYGFSQMIVFLITLILFDFPLAIAGQLLKKRSIKSVIYYLRGTIAGINSFLR